ncbi:MAG TPA: hypothetical protein PLR87_10875 [Thermoanaerobaculaceae bacterium]|nr:hypothetical protein [Thermoanaerobaculaceae bacterium]
MPPLPAGKGQHRVYTIRPANPSDTAKLTAGNHYVGVDAVAWYLNKESTWFADRMASGTLKVQLADGRESYEVALGTFELSGGGTIAPVFDKPVVPDRNYRGGVLTFTASLTALRKDTALAALLRSASRASLGVAAGMVATATVAGPAALLATAGADLIQGVTGLLANGPNREPIFDFSGLEANLRPEQVIGPELYLLFHRGSPLDESRLEVRVEGLSTFPLHAGAPLQDGAWLLLRVRRGGAGGLPEPARLLRPQPVLPHQPRHSRLPAPDALSSQLPLHPCSAVCLTAGSKHRPALHAQPPVLSLPHRDRPLPPPVVPTGRDIQGRAHDADRVHLAVLLDEHELHQSSSKTIPSAFFRMSRSMVTRRTCRCSRRTSSSRSTSRPLPGNAEPPSCSTCRFHRRSMSGRIPSSRDTSSILAPLSFTSLTASALNSRLDPHLNTPPLYGLLSVSTISRQVQASAVYCEPWSEWWITSFGRRCQIAMLRASRTSSVRR